MKNLKIDLDSSSAGLSFFVDFMDKPFQEAVKNLGQVQKKALDTAAFILKEGVKKEFISKMPAAGRPFKTPATSKGGYKITRDDMLSDAVRQASAGTTFTKVFMGGREPGSPLFLARIYNKGSEDRYQKTYRGKKLKAKHYLGRVKGLNYFQPGIEGQMGEAYNAVGRIMKNYTEKYFE